MASTEISQPWAATTGHLLELSQPAVLVWRDGEQKIWTGGVVTSIVQLQ